MISLAVFALCHNVLVFVLLQEEYYATHQCFLTRRSLYLLLWDITQGIEGLKSLQPWLENIEGRAPKSPVIVVATHLDQVPQADRNNVTSKLQAKFEELYLKDTHRKYTYPRIHEQCQFISINSTKNIDALRDYIYDFALLYKVPGRCSGIIVIPKSQLYVRLTFQKSYEAFIHADIFIGYKKCYKVEKLSISYTLCVPCQVHFFYVMLFLQWDHVLKTLLLYWTSPSLSLI